MTAEASLRSDLEDVRRVHLDPAVLARHLRGGGPLAGVTAELFRLHRDGGPALQTSMFSVFQLMTEPYRRDEPDLAEKATTYLSAGPVDLVPVTEDVARRAAEVRARLGFGPGRCLQIATALETGAERYLTESSSLRRIADVRVLDLRSYL